MFLSLLPRSLADLTAENERLNEEKDVLVESLLAQTEKLEREREERMKVLLFHNIHSDASKEGLLLFSDLLAFAIRSSIKQEHRADTNLSSFLSDAGEAGANGASGANGANGAGRGPKSPSGSGLLSDREQQLMDLIKVRHGRMTTTRNDAPC